MREWSAPSSAPCKSNVLPHRPRILPLQERVSPADTSDELPTPRPGGIFMHASGALFVSMDAGREVELVAAAKEGNLGAYLDLVRHYQRPIYRLAYAMARNESAAATLAQATFVRAWKEIRDFPEGRRFFPWLLRMARGIFAGMSSPV